MFYQNNNDYMRDAFYYSQPQNSTYQYPDMNGYNVMPQNNIPNNMTSMNNMPYTYGMNYNASQPNALNNMYPQVYKIIDPVANRVISNNNYPYYTEDNLNNMVDTVYNIVQGDVSSLTSIQSAETMASDDTVTQGTARNASGANNTQRQVTNTVQTQTAQQVANTQNANNDNQLLKDLIKIIIIKQLLSRPNNCRNCNNMNNMQTPNYYDPRYMGMM